MLLLAGPLVVQAFHSLVEGPFPLVKELLDQISLVHRVGAVNAFQCLLRGNVGKIEPHTAGLLLWLLWSHSGREVLLCSNWC